VSVKLGWDLAADAAEKNTLARTAAGCPATDVTVNPVP
jgi:hypothetical protein